MRCLKMWILWKNETLKMWILWKMRLWKCEFCKKWDFENVNFVKNYTLKMWILSKIGIFRMWIELIHLFGYGSVGLPAYSQHRVSIRKSLLGEEEWRRGDLRKYSTRRLKEEWPTAIIQIELSDKEEGKRIIDKLTEFIGIGPHFVSIANIGM